MVTHGRTRSLRRTNDGLVSFTTELAPAAGSSCSITRAGQQEELVELVVLYLVLLFIYPETMMFLTGVLVLACAAAL